MSGQALLSLDPHPADFGTGFDLGWDHAHYRVTPPVQQMVASNPVWQGFCAGQQQFGNRTLLATRHVRKWLRLRLSAWLRDRSFEPLQVTPALLKQIEVEHCPVTGEYLTYGTLSPSDASVDRVCNDAGYAAGNLAVMSTRVNRAKSSYGWDDALGFARQIEAGGLGNIDGLNAEQWSRLAVLMSFVTPLAHEQVACLPLLVLPPRRLRVLNPVQALQVMLTLQFARPLQGGRINELAGLLPRGEPRQAFSVFMNTLLARRLATGRLSGPVEARQAMEALWRDPLVNRRWQRLALRLTAPSCEFIVERAAARGLGCGDWRFVPVPLATEGWALETGGYAPPQSRQHGSQAVLAGMGKPSRAWAKPAKACEQPTLAN